MEDDTKRKLDINFNIPTLNSSYSLSSPVLNTEPCVNISRLKSFYCQNFTSILNNPEFSFIDEVVTKFQRLDTYTGKDMKKLSDLSPKSVNGGKKNKKSVKEEKEENFEDYLNKIEKRNHKRASSSEHNITLSMLEDNNNINSYQRRNLNIPAEYLVPKYKLSHTLLNLNVEELYIYSEELTEKCGELDYQMNILLFNSGKLTRYIYNNLELQKKVDYFHFKIQKFKTSNKLLKSKLLLNSLSTIKLGCKKSNLNKIQIIIGHIKILQENLSQLKEYAEDSSKLQEFFEIYNKSVYIIDTLKSDNIEIKVLNYIEEEYSELFKKITNKLYGELIQFSMDQLFKSVIYLEFSPKETFNTDLELLKYSEKFEFDLSVFKQSHILQILGSIEFPSATESFQKKLNEILSYVYKVDIDLGLKIRNLLKKIFNDEMINNTKNLTELFIDAYSTLQNKKIEKDFYVNIDVVDQSLFIFLLNKVYIVLYECMEVILNSIQRESINYLKELNVENDQIVEYEGLYSEEMQQIRKICLEDMTKIIEKYVNINFDFFSKLPLNVFLENYKTSLMIIENNKLLNKNIMDNVLLQLQESYIFDYFATISNEINIVIDNEEWKEVNFSQTYQTIVNFIINNNIKSLKEKGIMDVLKEISKYELISEELNEQIIGVSGEKYKIINSILFIIKFLFDTEKLIIIMESSLSEIISQKIIKLIRDYSNKCSYMIIGGEAYKLKKISINQKNICVYLSSLMFLNELIQAYSLIISGLTGNNIIGIEGLFSDLEKNIDKGKQKLLDLSLDIISQSFTLVSFDWHKDPSTVLKDKIEKFFTKQKTVLTIYTAITNYLPLNFSLELAKIIINNLIENYRKSLSEMTKIESKNNAKQILMEKVKKLIEYFKLTDANYYYAIFDECINNYAPKPAEKEKNIDKNDD